MAMLNSDAKEKLDEIVKYITNSYSYKKCIELKKDMNDDLIKGEVNEIKKLQKLYIREKDDDIKDILDEKVNKLNSMPIYSEYNYYLEDVNNMINLVKDELNDYFYELLNKKIDL